MLRTLAKTLVSRTGFDLVRNSGWRPENLHKPGFAPKTVFDVGAAFGTPALYRAFPESCHVLIEPLHEYKPYLEQTLRKYTAHYLPCAVGPSKAKLAIHVEPEKIMKSSFHERTELTTTGKKLELREVDVRTLDDIAADLQCKPPFGIKINASGFEYQVIQGAQRVLPETHFVIAEISIAKRFKNCNTFADFVRIMDESGFRLCDILDAPRRNHEVVLVNAVFKRDV